MLKRLFSPRQKEQSPLTESDYLEATNYLADFLGQNWINELQSGRIPFGGAKAMVGDKEQQLFYIPPEGVTNQNAVIYSSDDPFIISKSFVDKVHGAPLGDATEQLLDVAIVTNISRVIREQLEKKSR
ncbi:MAG: hypothetical protein WCG44_00695 [bacterium]